MPETTIRRRKHPMTDVVRRIRDLAVNLGAVRARVRFGQATSGLRILPSWIIAGAQRSSSSSVFKYLIAHPQVGAPAVKEIHYFDNNYHRGLNWYLGHFPLRQGGRITGEGSPYYLAHPLAPRRIAKDLPSVKLLVVLRNPVDRAYSHFIHERALGRECYASFAEAIEHEDERIAGEEEKMLADPTYNSHNHRNFSYVARGRYAEQIERLFDTFPRERVMVFSSERLSVEPARVYAEILTFLGLPPYELQRFRRHNQRSYAPMDPAVRARLQEYFTPENERLYKLLGTDFGWNSPVNQECVAPG
jgi:hypothetical protein